MALIARIPAGRSIRAFRAAAGQRYREGRRLALAGDRLTAIYLWGYTAEMLLKAAFFRLRGWLLTQAITLADLYDAQLYAIQTLQLAWPEKNLHELPRWRELLVEERKRVLNPYPWPFARRFSASVTRIYLNWREHLRYHPNRPYRGEVGDTFQAVSWLLGQYRHLQGVPHAPLRHHPARAVAEARSIRETARPGIHRVEQ
jgi:hypothetical protein